MQPARWARRPRQLGKFSKSNVDDALKELQKAVSAVAEAEGDIANAKTEKGEKESELQRLQGQQTELGEKQDALEGYDQTVEGAGETRDELVSEANTGYTNACAKAKESFGTENVNWLNDWLKKPAGYLKDNRPLAKIK